MRYRLLGATGLRVSELCLGTMTFGTDWGWGADRETAREMYTIFRDAGGTFFDTADRYTEGTSEAFLGDFIEGHREEVVIATKYTDGPLDGPAADPNAAGNHRKRMREALEGSLRRLGTDHVDLLWVHAWDFMTPVAEVMRGLDDLVRQGKVLSLGISDTPAWVAAQANALAEARGWTPFAAVQLEYSLVERTAERELLPMARGMGLTPLAWSPLAGGLLTGKYSGDEPEAGRLDAFSLHPMSERNRAIADAVVEVGDAIGRPPAQVALRWVIDRGVMPIVGARRPAHLTSNLEALGVRLEDEHNERLEAVSAISLGFPHEFLEATRAVTYGGFYEQIDGPRRGAPLHWNGPSRAARPDRASEAA
jgi:aryl-alcohol dehydrogenase-like predicted oxidoreductase